MSLCNLLEARRLSCWIAPRDIRPGNEYAADISAGLEQCGSMVVLVSRASNASKHVLREVEHAVSSGKPIFPILLERVALSRALDYYIRPIHWIELGAAPLEVHADTLAHAVKGNPDWQTRATAPTVARRLRYLSGYAFGVALSSIIVGAVVAGGLLYHLHKVAADKDEANRNSAVALGWIQPTLIQDSGSPSNAHLAIRVFVRAGVPFSRVELRLTGVTADPPYGPDPTLALTGPPQSSPQDIRLRVSSLQPIVHSCLSVPATTGELRRVLQVFLLEPASVQVPGSGAGTLTPKGAEQVLDEHGQPCTAE